MSRKKVENKWIFNTVSYQGDLDEVRHIPLCTVLDMKKFPEPPDKGDLGGWVFRQRDLARVSCTVSQAGWKPSANPCCLMGGTGEGQ